MVQQLKAQAGLSEDPRLVLIIHMVIINHL